MASKTLTAREIEIPADLPEKLDAIAGHPIGDLRNMLADSGMAHTDKMNKELFKIALGREIKGLMGNDALPGKPHSSERFRDMIFATTFAYILGTCYFNENGDLNIGHNRDIAFVSKILDTDKVKFRNGKTCDPQHFLLLLNVNTQEEQTKAVYHDVYGRGVMKKTPKAKDWFNLASLITTVGDKIVENVTK